MADPEGGKATDLVRPITLPVAVLLSFLEKREGEPLGRGSGKFRPAPPPSRITIHLSSEIK